MNTITKILFTLALTAPSAMPAYAGGIALGATRVVYPQNEKQVSLPVMNTDKNMRFLIQSWVSDAKGNKVADFVITPPLFVIKPQKENKIRIMYIGDPLPQDRESVFYLNSQAVPSVPRESLQGNTLQIATQSVIKLFMRPAGLPSRSVDAPKTLSCQFSSGKVTIKNPSPYYVTLVQLQVGNKKLVNNMVAPKSSLTLDSAGVNANSIRFSTLNDFGANTPVQNCGA